jgi:alkanesulfonate monooxygenase SsuD/methylene tetrahydromethanopterin reductase-like flavin-dependent oxidoreductase (luciferase family)
VAFLAGWESRLHHVAMRLATIHLQNIAWADLGRELADAEAAGVDCAYVADHLTHPTMQGEFIADAWTTLGAASQVTSRIDLGTLVASAGFRSALPLARAAATVQQLSGGRCVFGLGAGTASDAQVALHDTPSPADQTRRYAATVAELDRIFRGEQPGIDSLPAAPGHGRPFLMLAAHGPRSFELVARYADGWSTYGGGASTTLDAAAYWSLLTDQRRAVDLAFDRIGRDPSRLRRSVLLGYGTIRPVESASGFRECLARAEEAGFDEVVVYWPRSAEGTRFWADPAVFAECLSART